MNGCWLWHRWGKWSRAEVKYSPGPILIHMGQTTDWTSTVQMRRCERCGLEEIRPL